MRVHLYTTWLNVCKYEQGYPIKCWSRKEEMPHFERESRMHIDVASTEIVGNGGDSSSVIVRKRNQGVL
ncbi:hypothetical protein ACEU2D_15860 [Brevibacillus laterosporus]|uniref:hypothetical protein n=1 Tax=Brevibacillus laterosporus TaxID=1465 RepID=UPI0035A65F33